MARRWLPIICFGLVIAASAQKDSPSPTSSPLELTPSGIDFGSQSVGTRSRPQTATLTNHSAWNVTIRDVTASGIDFSETDTCQGTLAAGAHCTIDVTFAPAIAGTRLGTVLVTTDSPNPLFLVLKGMGE